MNLMGSQMFHSRSMYRGYMLCCVEECDIDSEKGFSQCFAVYIRTEIDTYLCLHADTCLTI